MSSLVDCVKAKVISHFDSENNNNNNSILSNEDTHEEEVQVNNNMSTKSSDPQPQHSYLRRFSEFGKEKEEPNVILAYISSWFNWFHKLRKAAAAQREVYHKEGNYTVADCITKDVRIIRKHNMPIILVLTAPGTPVMALVHRLTNTYGLYHLNIGALIQREIELEMNRDFEVHHLMHRGVAIPRAFLFELIRRQMANICQRKQHKGFIITEYPSTYSQTWDFFEHICKPDYILYIKFSDKLTQENIFIYLKFQVRASKVLRRIHPDIQAVSMEQAKKFRREVDKIRAAWPKRFKTVAASAKPEALCLDIMKWIERAEVLHGIIPPLFVDPPLPMTGDEERQQDV